MPEKARQIVGGALAASSSTEATPTTMRDKEMKIMREVKQSVGAEGTIFVDVVPPIDEPDQPTVHAFLEEELTVDALSDHNGCPYV